MQNGLVVTTGKFNKPRANVSPKDAENHQKGAIPLGNGAKLTHLIGIRQAGVVENPLIGLSMAPRQGEAA
jgi:hypothetical protein